MDIRFYIDPRTHEPHIHGHEVEVFEVLEVLASPVEDGPGTEGARVAIGQTQGGRYLRVIYVPDPDQDGIFIITAYELGPKALKAFRRRLRRRQ